MRTIKGLVVVIIAAIAPASAAVDGLTDFQKQCPNILAISAFVFDGRMIQVKIPVDGLEASPPWNVSNCDEPPLKPGRAVQLASAEFRRAVSDPSEWHVANVGLRLLQCLQRSYYEVTWQRNLLGPQSEVVVPVLMSGTVVPMAKAIAEAK